MTKRFSILLVVLTIVSGLIGGAITGRIFTPKVAIAKEATQSKVLTVEGLRVVDKSGKLLMQLGKDSNNIEKDYGLFIYDDSGQFGVIVDVSESGGNVWVIGKNSIGVPGTASMGINESGGIVSIMGKDGDGAGMLMDESGGSVSVSGKGGNAGMRVGENGGAVSVYDKDFKAGAMMSVIESGGMVGVRDNDGKPKATIVVSDYGNGSIDLLDKDGNKIK